MRWGEAMVEALVATSDDAVVGVDAAGGVVSWNRGAERVFGRPAADAVGEALAGLFPAHLRPELQIVLTTVAAGEPVHHVETEIVRGDGLPVPLLLSVTPVLDGRPRSVTAVVGALAVARDLTEQRLAQARLAELEEQVREAEALAHVGSWLWDVHTGTVQWSEELHRIHDVEPLDFEGTLDAHLRLVHPDDRRRVRAALHEAVALTRGTQPLDLRYRVRRPGGEERELHVRAQPALDSTGAVLGLRGIGQDVTDRR